MAGFLAKTDPEMAELIAAEKKRRQEGLEMIPSENHTSPAVLEALASILNDKYAEGYPSKRYYGGNVVIDQVEKLVIERAKKLFGVPHANVQPYSGSPANFAVYLAVCENGDVIMGQNLSDGGHLTHGAKVNASARFFQSVPYHLREDGYLDMEEVRRLALEHKPKLIWCGATAYSREIPFEEFGKIADEVGAYLAADIAHIAGLVIGEVHKSPAPFVHIITTTTHKTLRGPRGAMIMVTEKGMKKDPELGQRIDKAVFPAGVQGGPHEHQIAAIGVALKEASEPAFTEYSKQVVKNARTLSQELMNRELKIVSGGTDNHLMVLDLTLHGKGLGIFLEEALDMAGITVNKNTVPQEFSSPFYPSGVRLGTPAITTRGMKENEMAQIGGYIAQVVNEIKAFSLPDDKEGRIAYLKDAKKRMKESAVIKKVREEVKELCGKFPIP
ncbi:MAG: serine hydroxymethyltransferase [Parcubacteria group bacterium]|nr:serine hydroxymethyltransferase [Parcubacteria group bacterium]